MQCFLEEITFSLVNISKVIGWEGWVFCIIQEIDGEDRL